MTMAASTSTRSRIRVIAAAAGGPAPAFSRLLRPVSGRRRRGRMARRCSSRVPPATTYVFDGVGCSVLLNNRYQDPTTGVFVSVDPLVSMTGEPYLYANGNPTTLSDPSGLCSAYSPTSGIIDDGRGKCQERRT